MSVKIIRNSKHLFRKTIKVVKDVLYFKLMRNEWVKYLIERLKFRLVYMIGVEFEETNNY